MLCEFFKFIERCATAHSHFTSSNSQQEGLGLCVPDKPAHGRTHTVTHCLTETFHDNPD